MSGLNARQILLDTVVDNNNSFDIGVDHLITEDVIQAMMIFAQKYHETKMKANEASTSHDKALDIDLVVNCEQCEKCTDGVKKGSDGRMLCKHCIW